MVIRTVITPATVLVIPLLLRMAAGECGLQESHMVESGVVFLVFVLFPSSVNCKLFLLIRLRKYRTIVLLHVFLYPSIYSLHGFLNSSWTLCLCTIFLCCFLSPAYSIP